MGGSFGAIKPGLTRIRLLLSYLGNPQNSFSTLQVTGSNGKGSVSAFLNHIFIECGFKTGLFTSPHILYPEERILVDNECFQGEVKEALEDLRKGFTRKFGNHIAGRPTYFELMAALAFAHFKAMGVEVAVGETGLGGRLDAVSSANPRGMVLTSISRDHTEFLGNSLEEILLEKIGGPGGNFLVSSRIPQYLTRLAEYVCEKNGSELFVCGRDFFYENLEEGYFHFYSSFISMERVFITMKGDFQKGNAACAIRGAIELGKHLTIPEKMIKSAVSKGLRSATISGRFQTVKKNPHVILDVGHNPSAGQVLNHEISQLAGEIKKRIACVFTMKKNREVYPFLKSLGNITDKFIYYQGGEDAHSPESLCRDHWMGTPQIETAKNLHEALSLAKRYCGKGGIILLTGSFTVAEDYFIRERCESG